MLKYFHTIVRSRFVFNWKLSRYRAVPCLFMICGTQHWHSSLLSTRETFFSHRALNILRSFFKSSINKLLFCTFCGLSTKLLYRIETIEQRGNIAWKSVEEKLVQFDNCQLDFQKGKVSEKLIFGLIYSTVTNLSSISTTLVTLQLCFILFCI